MPEKFVQGRLMAELGSSKTCNVAVYQALLKCAYRFVPDIRTIKLGIVSDITCIVSNRSIMKQACRIFSQKQLFIHAEGRQGDI